MSINATFLIIGCALLCVVVPLTIIVFKHEFVVPSVFFEAHPGLYALAQLGSAVCAGICIACMILAFVARECPECDIIVKGNYCEECGYQVRNEEYREELHCPECGTDIDEGTLFCGHCGTPIPQE